MTAHRRPSVSMGFHTSRLLSSSDGADSGGGEGQRRRGGRR